jgi:hypothetical protein
LIDGPAILGGYDNHATPTNPAAPTLKVRALAMFGGIEIKTARRAPSSLTASRPRPLTGPAGRAPLQAA